jgi:hypothetical protein
MNQNLEDSDVSQWFLGKDHPWGIFRCTQTFWGMVSDAPKRFGEDFSMHPNIFGDDFRCTQTFLGMIFDAPKHFW